MCKQIDNSHLLCKCGERATKSITETDGEENSMTLLGCKCKDVWLIADCYHCKTIKDERNKPEECSICKQYICKECGRCSPKCAKEV